MLFEFVLITGFWIRTDVPGLCIISAPGIHLTHIGYISGVGPLNQPRHVRAVAYWFAATGFTIVLWYVPVRICVSVNYHSSLSCRTARMSMLFSVIRIIPHKQPLRRFAFYCAALFVGMWAALLCQKIYICGRDTSWMHLSVPQCHLGKHVGITELVSKWYNSPFFSASGYWTIFFHSWFRCRYNSGKVISWTDMSILYIFVVYQGASTTPLALEHQSAIPYAKTTFTYFFRQHLGYCSQHYPCCLLV